MNKNNKTKVTFLHCKCHCGKEFDTRKPNISRIKSCGCSRSKLKDKAKKVIGETYGRLTIIGIDKQRTKKENMNGKHMGLFVICRCQCGNEKTYHYGTIRSGHIKSCGCLVSEATIARNKRDSTKYNHVSVIKENKVDYADDVVKVYDEDRKDFFIIDKTDYEFIKNWFWRKDKKGYWVTNAKKEDIEKYNKKSLKVHQLVATRKYGEYDTKSLFPDHLSRDKSDNRRCNLILKSNQDNMKNRSLSKANTSGKTGVCFMKSKNRWSAYITVGYKTISLGNYLKYEDAVLARLRAEEKYGFTCDDKVANYDY